MSKSDAGGRKIALLLDCDQRMAGAVSAIPPGYWVVRFCTFSPEAKWQMSVPGFAPVDADLIVDDDREPFAYDPVGYESSSEARDDVCPDVFPSVEAFIVPREQETERFELKLVPRDPELMAVRFAVRRGAIAVVFVNSCLLEYGGVDEFLGVTVPGLRVGYVRWPVRDLSRCEVPSAEEWGDFFDGLRLPMQVRLAVDEAAWSRALERWEELRFFSRSLPEMVDAPFEVTPCLINRAGQALALMIRDGDGAVFVLPEFEDNAAATKRLVIEIWPKLREREKGALEERRASANGHSAETRGPQRAADCEQLLKANKLHMAVLRGAVGTVCEMLKADPELASAPIGGEGSTALHLATQPETMAVAEVLMASGADVNADDEYGWRPLHNAAGNGSDALVELLIDRGAEVNAKNSVGITPLHQAARFGHDTAARLLIERGADVNAVAEGGCTPLHCAAEEGAEEVVQLLLANSARVNARGSLLGDRLSSSLGLDADDAVTRDQVTAPGATALHWAALEGHEAIVRALVACGARVDARDEDGYSPLHAVAPVDPDTDDEQGRIGAARILLGCGAEINAASHSGATPLHLAAAGNLVGLMELLLAEGADPAAEDAQGRTPLQYAFLEGSQEAGELLARRAAAQPDAEAAPTPAAAGERGVAPTEQAPTPGAARIHFHLSDNGNDIEGCTVDGVLQTPRGRTSIGRWLIVLLSEADDRRMSKRTATDALVGDAYRWSDGKKQLVAWLGARVVRRILGEDRKNVWLTDEVSIG